MDAETRAERVAIARDLGHSHLKIGPTESGARFWVRCSCGWGKRLKDGRPTVTAATEREAVLRLQHHLEKAVAAHVMLARQTGTRNVLGRRLGVSQTRVLDQG